MKRLELWVISSVLLLSAILILAFNHRFASHKNPEVKYYTIKDQWDLPDVLEEVSGIAWIGNDELATVQDEDGIIFIYNLERKSITNKIEFAGAGDYEEIVVDESTAYVLRSDGKLFEVLNFRSSDIEVNSYDLSKFEDSNMEAMALDKSNERLLLIAKDKDPDRDDKKGIYSFSLKNMTLEEKAVMTIDMQQDAFEDFQRNSTYKTLRPSALSIHPVSGEIYLLDGVRPKLLILNSSAELQDIYILDQSDFAQAEGLSFSPSGDLYISNEANKNPANILKVLLTSRDGTK